MFDTQFPLELTAEALAMERSELPDELAGMRIRQK